MQGVDDKQLICKRPNRPKSKITLCSWMDVLDHPKHTVYQSELGNDRCWAWKTILRPLSLFEFTKHVVAVSSTIFTALVYSAMLHCCSWVRRTILLKSQLSKSTDSPRSDEISASGTRHNHVQDVAIKPHIFGKIVRRTPNQCFPIETKSFSRLASWQQDYCR